MENLSKTLEKDYIGNILINLLKECSELEHINLNTTIEDLDLDSLESYEIVYGIEKETGVRISDKELIEIRDNIKSYNIKKLRDTLWEKYKSL